MRIQVLTAVGMKMRAFWDIAPCNLDDSEVRTASIIAVMMAAVRTFETSVYYNETTQRNIAGGYHN
jgi:hypothetical protein